MPKMPYEYWLSSFFATYSDNFSLATKPRRTERLLEINYSAPEIDDLKYLLRTEL